MRNTSRALFPLAVLFAGALVFACSSTTVTPAITETPDAAATPDPDAGTTPEPEEDSAVPAPFKLTSTMLEEGGSDLHLPVSLPPVPDACPYPGQPSLSR